MIALNTSFTFKTQLVWSNFTFSDSNFGSQVNPIQGTYQQFTLVQSGTGVIITPPTNGTIQNFSYQFNFEFPKAFQVRQGGGQTVYIYLQYQYIADDPSYDPIIPKFADNVIPFALTMYGTSGRPPPP